MGYSGGMVARPPELYGIRIEDLARLCRVSLRTARRWKDGQIVPPQTALMVLRLLYMRELDLLGAEWQGWKLYPGGILISPDGWEINRNHALSVPLMEGQIHALRQKLAGLEATHDALEEQPGVDEPIPALQGL